MPHFYLFPNRSTYHRVSFLSAQSCLSFSLFRSLWPVSLPKSPVFYRKGKTRAEQDEQKFIGTRSALSRGKRNRYRDKMLGNSQSAHPVDLGALPFLRSTRIHPAKRVSCGREQRICLVKRKRRKLSNGHKRVVPVDLLSIPFILISLQRTFVIVRRRGALYSIYAVLRARPCSTARIIITICLRIVTPINIHKVDPSKRLPFTLTFLYFLLASRAATYATLGL